MFNEAPMLADMVAAGDLPSVEERLPDRGDIMVVQPRESIGTYGGEITFNATNPTSFGNTGFTAWDQHLTGFSTNWEIVFPEIAKSVELSDDLLTATVTLRSGMKWSDGTPVSADDVMFWYEDIMQHEELPNLSNALKPGGTALVVEKVDDMTVSFTAAQPNPAFPIVVARSSQGFPLAPGHYLKQWHADYNEDAQALSESEGYDTWAGAFQFHMNGQTGQNDFELDLPVFKPWTLDQVDDFGNKFYVRNPYYWKVDTEGNQLPYIDRQVRLLLGEAEVVILNVQAGAIDYGFYNLEVSDLPVLKAGEAEGNYTTILWPADQGAMSKYQFNITVSDPVLNEIFNDLRFRQAMSLAINRDEINEVLFFGQAVSRAWGVSSASAFYEDWMGGHYADYDPDQANALLDEMGLSMGDDGVRMRPDGEPLAIVLWDSINRIPMSELVNEVHASTWFADVVSEKDMYQRPIWLRPPYGIDSTPVGGGLAWRQWWLSGGEEGEEPPEYKKEQMRLVDEWQLTAIGSDRYIVLGTLLVANTVRNIYHIGPVGEAPEVFVRSNRLHNFTPAEGVVYISHLESGHSDQWYVSE